MIVSLSIERYLREVAPSTLDPWGRGADLEAHRAATTDLATTPLIARQRAWAVGMPSADADVIASSCKRFDREIAWRRGGERETHLRAVGIGSLFTPPALRGRGHATLLLGALLDDERAHGADVAYLTSDIHPAFYERLGFVALPSRVATRRAADLASDATAGEPFRPRDLPAVRACFAAADDVRAWRLSRTPLVWEWIRTRWAVEDRTATSQAVRVLVRDGRGVAAYAIGRRVPQADAFALDDFAARDEAAGAALRALVRGAAGDLTRVTGWLPPEPGRALYAAASIRRRKTGTLMIAPLSTLGRAWWRDVGATTLTSRADALWPADHV